MTPLDWLLSVAGLAGFIFFVGIVISFVPEPDLIVVVSVTVLFAAYDFLLRPILKRRR